MAITHSPAKYREKTVKNKLFGSVLFSYRRSKLCYAPHPCYSFKAFVFLDLLAFLVSLLATLKLNG